MMEKIIENIANKNMNNQADGDYINADGLLMCGKCNTPKQCVQEFPYNSGKFKKFPCICDCEKRAEVEFQQRMQAKNMQAHISALKKQGISDEKYLHNTFENDDNRAPTLTSTCKRYVEKWDKFKEHSYGILFYGDTGGGKSYHACCIANSLLSMGIPVLISRLSDLVKNRTDRESVDIDLEKYKLIVLDDIGVENTSQTAYNIIDDIYRHNIPLLVTTNLTPNELKYPSTLEKKRMYDRILEMCPITLKVDVVKSRLDIAKAKKIEAISILNGK